MTVRQKQWQLFYLGYYGESTADIDGIWGPKSLDATRRFQADAGIAVDGIFGPNTEAKTMEMVDAIQDVVTGCASKPLVNDGLAGPATMAATVWYQKAKGLIPDGIAGPQTRTLILETVAPPQQETPEDDDWWDEIEYFDREEFKCKCGGRYCNGYPAEMKKTVVLIADAARKHFGAPATVVSGLRCPIHNVNEGGVANSQHMYGEAIDLRVHGVSGDSLLAFVKTQTGLRYAYKINSTNVHFDVRKGSA